MSRVKGKMYFTKEELRDHLAAYTKTMQNDGLEEHEINERLSSFYTNVAIRKYDKKEQDRMWDELYHLIMEVPGGYWQVVENMDYLPEFEHYRFECLKSAFGAK